MSHEFGSLEWFRSRAGVDPWLFWGWQCASCCGGSTCKSCGASAWAEHGWQNYRVSREDVRNAITEAIDLFEQITGNPASDKYHTEIVKINRWTGNACDLSGAELCYPVKRLGAETVTSIGEFPVVYLDSDRVTDAFGAESECARPSWFKVSFLPDEPIDAECEYQIHVPTDERFGDTSGDTLIAVLHTETSADGTITVWGRPWQMAKPSERDAADCEPIDCAIEENYLESVEVIMVCHVECGTDIETACAVLMTDSLPCECCNCCGESADGKISMARIAGSGRHGRIEIPNSVWNADTNSWSCCNCMCAPTHVQIKYLAGRHDCDKTADLIAPLAAGLLPTICEFKCGSGCNLLEKWMQDFTIDSQGDSTLNVPFDFNNNPFGFTYGAGLAYQRLMKLPGYFTGRAVAL